MGSEKRKKEEERLRNARFGGYGKRRSVNRKKKQGWLKRKRKESYWREKRKREGTVRHSKTLSQEKHRKTTFGEEAEKKLAEQTPIGRANQVEEDEI